MRWAMRHPMSVGMVPACAVVTFQDHLLSIPWQGWIILGPLYAMALAVGVMVYKLEGVMWRLKQRDRAVKLATQGRLMMQGVQPVASGASTSVSSNLPPPADELIEPAPPEVDPDEYPELVGLPVIYRQCADADLYEEDAESDDELSHFEHHYGVVIDGVPTAAYCEGA